VLVLLNPGIPASTFVSLEIVIEVGKIAEELVWLVVEESALLALALTAVPLVKVSASSATFSLLMMEVVAAKVEIATAVVVVVVLLLLLVIATCAASSLLPAVVVVTETT
jgi:hypothetical protein